MTIHGHRQKWATKCACCGESLPPMVPWPLGTVCAECAAPEDERAEVEATERDVEAAPIGGVPF